ncbi:MAG: hypothetical protein OHK93_000174 [Ramalina farinacea]|uniref:Prokaryotic-type class I peptide chain release factors domain-containing protein n=1 Tax=Ramalina farinacea TaxID=258253 RepID=A0AA43TSA3_9LECA|nr:hypothetical protein [Ramalina farinacea]
MLRRISIKPSLQQVTSQHHFGTSNRLADPRPLDAESEEEHRQARQWMNDVDVKEIAKSMCDISFSRSSGPGGQNVNKVSSKATFRLDVDRFLPQVPKLLHESIKSSRYYANKSNSLVIQADTSRSQGDNVRDCYTKLHQALKDAAKSSIKGESSREQVEKVKRLQKQGNESRLRSKKSHGSKKAARKSGSSKGDL